MAIEGVGPDVPVETNELGGGQSSVPYRFDLVDGHAMFAMTGVLYEGAKKYGANNWRAIPIEDHLNHLIMHAYAWLAGDESDDHLSHIMCRAMFAQGIAAQGGPKALDQAEPIILGGPSTEFKATLSNEERERLEAAGLIEYMTANRDGSSSIFWLLPADMPDDITIGSDEDLSVRHLFNEARRAFGPFVGLKYCRPAMELHPAGFHLSSVVHD